MLKPRSSTGFIDSEGYIKCFFVFFCHFSTVDGYGFQRSENFDQKAYDAFMAEYLPVLTRRAVRWNNVFGNSDSFTKTNTGLDVAILKMLL